MEKQSRWRSRAAWATLIAQAVIIVGIFWPDVSDTIKAIGTALIAVAAGFGAFNNPENKTGF